ncbi:hypothetical protein [Archaeoglobus neptunius]|uniref:hypothetical protein n=1 Tax=Archaeoglobus neptunius TaxID=2798580 RepID=UPI001927E387|nr:hypothetical protein [Archaeoglobus neptunius]
MPDAYFCTNCFFFGYAKTMTYQKIRDGFGDDEYATESAPLKIECPECGGTIVAVEVDDSTYELMQKIATHLEKMYFEGEDTESEFEFHDYPRYSRVLTYFALKNGRNPRKVDISHSWDGPFIYTPIDDVTNDLLLRKLTAKKPHVKELAEELLKEPSSSQANTTSPTRC